MHQSSGLAASFCSAARRLSSQIGKNDAASADVVVSGANLAAQLAVQLAAMRSPRGVIEYHLTLPPTSLNRSLFLRVREGALAERSEMSVPRWMLRSVEEGNEGQEKRASSTAKSLVPRWLCGRLNRTKGEREGQGGKLRTSPCRRLCRKLCSRLLEARSEDAGGRGSRTVPRALLMASQS